MNSRKKRYNPLAQSRDGKQHRNNHARAPDAPPDFDLPPDAPTNFDPPKDPDDTRRKPKNSGTYLKSETTKMDRQRREMEQQGHRQLARVNAREHRDEELTTAPEGELQNDIMQHPYLEAQRFDGIDPDMNPEPPLNSAARREYDNQRREQEMEKQLRLGNMPTPGTAPKPKGP